MAHLSSCAAPLIRRSQEGPVEGRPHTQPGMGAQGRRMRPWQKAGKREAKARGMRAFHLELLMASFSRAKNFSASSTISQASSSEISREME